MDEPEIARKHLSQLHGLSLSDKERLQFSTDFERIHELQAMLD